MSYRVDVAKNNRAGCIDKACKDAGDKITKGELRLGSWLELHGGEGHGSWKWKHWGCVSGLQLQHLRDRIARHEDGGGEDGDEDYDWEAIDGYDELGDCPHLQEKIRRVIKQGHIDPEDFKGDPEYNKLGSRGIRGRVTKKDIANEGSGDEPTTTIKTKTKTAQKKSASAKLGRKKASLGDDDDDDAQLIPPVKEKQMKAESTPEPAKKAPVKKTAKKSAPQAKEQQQSSDELEPVSKKAKESAKKPTKKAGKKKAAAADAQDSEGEPDDIPEPAPKISVKASSRKTRDSEKRRSAGKKRGRATEASEADDHTMDDGSEGEEAPKPKKRGRAKTATAGEHTDELPAKKKRGRKG